MKEFIRGGAAYIQNLIDEAKRNGIREVTVSGNYEIDKEVRLPSDTTLILKDCHLRLADGSYTNIFVNEHHGTEVGKTLAGTDRDIRILGIGEAILDGGEYNGLSERNSLKDGMPHISHNNLLLFTSEWCINWALQKNEGLVLREFNRD